MNKIAKIAGIGTVLASSALFTAAHINTNQSKVKEHNNIENSKTTKGNNQSYPVIPMLVTVLGIPVVPKNKYGPMLKNEKLLNKVTQEKLSDKDYVPLDRDVLVLFRNGYKQAGKNLISHPNFDIANKENFYKAFKEVYSNVHRGLSDSYITYAVNVLKDEESVNMFAKELLSRENYDLNAINFFDYTDGQYLMRNHYFNAAKMYIENPKIDLLKRTEKHDIGYIECAAVRKDIASADEEFVNYLVQKTISNPNYDPNKENHLEETDFDILLNRGYGVAAKEILNLPEFNNIDLTKIGWAVKAEVKAKEDNEILDTMIYKTLLNPDFDPNKAYSDGRTALNDLIEYEYYEAAKTYLNHPELNILHRTKEDESYLSYAAKLDTDNDLVNLIAKKMTSTSDYYERSYRYQINQDIAKLVLGDHYDTAKMVIDYIQNEQREYNKRIIKE